MRSSDMRETTAPHLGLADGGNDAGNACLLQDLCVRSFVLPADVEEIAETTVMEVVYLLLMPPVQSPRFTAIEQCGEDDVVVDFQLC